MPLNAHRNDFPEVSPRLLRAIRKAGSARGFARMQNINIRYVSDLLSKGIEPTDRTEKGRAVRSKLYLPRTKPKPRKPRREWLPGEWQTLRRIGEMAKQTKERMQI